MGKISVLLTPGFQDRLRLGPEKRRRATGHSDTPVSWVLNSPHFKKEWGVSEVLGMTHGPVGTSQTPLFVSRLRLSDTLPSRSGRPRLSSGTSPSLSPGRRSSSTVGLSQRPLRPFRKIRHLVVRLSLLGVYRGPKDKPSDPTLLTRSEIKRTFFFQYVLDLCE